MASNQEPSPPETSTNHLTSAKPIPITSARREPPQSPQSGLFGWLGSLASPPPAQRGSFSGLTATKPPLDDSIALQSQNSAAQPVPLTRVRSRKDSSSLSHDEALNISRANQSLSPRIIESPFTEPLDTPVTNYAKSPTSGTTRRSRSNSKYDKLGLMAAHSGGPSSF